MIFFQLRSMAFILAILVVESSILDHKNFFNHNPSKLIKSSNIFDKVIEIKYVSYSLQ